ncbi:MAG: FecR family protein [Dysgonomonas sp.]
MHQREAHTNYSCFKKEDFLNDDFFISSHRQPTNETCRFWSSLLNNGNLIRGEYEQAVQLLQMLIPKQSVLPEDEVVAIWNTISTKNKAHTAKRRKQIGITVLSIAVACSLILIFLKQIPLATTEKNDLIVDFARSSKIEGPVKDVQLILSDSDQLAIPGKENIIIYDEDGLSVNNRYISEDVAGSFNRLITPKGKRSQLVLSDGSKIWLNSAGSLVYPVRFAKDKREIYVDGEIYLEVAHDPDRPFIVRTLDMNIQVLGTKFNVSSYENDATKRVVLVSGAVKIETNKAPVYLSPNKMYESVNGEIHIETVNASRYIAWISGLYYCDSKKMDEILDYMSRYYGIPIIYDKDVAELVCSGKLDLKNDPDKVLKDLSMVLSITYEPKGGGFSIKSKRMQ